MNVFFLTYANSHDAPLPSLQEEDDFIYRILTPAALRQHIYLHRDSFVSIDKVTEYIILFRKYLSVFLFSGHAGKDKLVMNGDEARSEGITTLLSQCPKLKLVFLNGCSTRGQVEALLQAGVPVVIATSAPVGDKKAAAFSTSFFDALSQDNAIIEAFNLAAGKVEALAEVAISRSADFEEIDEEAPLWGIYYREENKAVLEERLSSYVETPVPEGFRPNEALIASLMEALEAFSDEVGLYRLKERKGKQVSLPRKRMAILNSLPAPVAEHLRKLIAPIEDENKGYDKPGEARLRQLSQVYSVTMEQLSYTMLAQLWEAKMKRKEHFVIPEEHVRAILHFLDLEKEEKRAYDHLLLIRSIRKALDGNDFPYFVNELHLLKSLFQEKAEFMSACFFMAVLRQKVVDGDLLPVEVTELCIRAEENLAAIFKHMGFLAKYPLTAVNQIGVEKYRHSAEPKFEHSIINLVDLLGGYERRTSTLVNHYLDTRSVLLLKEEIGEKWEGNVEFLNLSPFIIDENAFKGRADSTVPEIMFFHHYDRERDSYFFQRVQKPDDPMLEAREDNKLQVVKIQFDAFRTILTQQ